MTSAAREEVWTTRRLLAWMSDAFTKKGLDSPRLQAEILLAHVIGCERLRLYMDPDRPCSPLERQVLRDLVGRALKHEPVQYLTGTAWFFGLPFHVDRRVLIPRPATETIVQEVLQHHRVRHGSAKTKGEGVFFADVCTGSGCIAIALLTQLTQARAIASDISLDALEVAKENARRHNVTDRLELLAGDLLTPVLTHPAAGSPGTLDYFVSNPPYIPDPEWDAVAPNVKDHEPHGALRGGAEGLDYITPLLAEAPRLVKPGGLLLLECADSCTARVQQLAQETGAFESVRVLADFEGLPRVVAGVKK